MEVAILEFILGPLANNTFLLIDKETNKGAVIDPSYGSEDVVKYIKDNNIELEWVINTHCHFDHIAGNSALVKSLGAKIAIHPLEKPILEMTPAMMELYNLDPFEIIEPEIFLKDSDIIKVGSIELKVRHSPGHSPGHIVLIGDGFVFAGDNLFAGSIGRSDLPMGNYHQLITSIRDHLLVLPNSTVVYCGHGPSTNIGRERICNPQLTE